MLTCSTWAPGPQISGWTRRGESPSGLALPFWRAAATTDLRRGVLRSVETLRPGLFKRGPRRTVATGGPHASTFHVKHPLGPASVRCRRTGRTEQRRRTRSHARVSTPVAERVNRRSDLDCGVETGCSWTYATTVRSTTGPTGRSHRTGTRSRNSLEGPKPFGRTVRANVMLPDRSTSNPPCHGNSENEGSRRLGCCFT